MDISIGRTLIFCRIFQFHSKCRKFNCKKVYLVIYLPVVICSKVAKNKQTFLSNQSAKICTYWIKSYYWWCITFYFRSDWKNYFDIYITYAKKTGGFFTKNEKFKGMIDMILTFWWSVIFRSYCVHVVLRYFFVLVIFLSIFLRVFFTVILINMPVIFFILLFLLHVTGFSNGKILLLKWWKWLSGRWLQKGYPILYG